MINVIFLVFLFIVGSVFGSFIAAYTYRAPRGIKISNGRSKCPRCKKVIPWYDNLPLLSYINLRGKARCCGKPISIRYPLIEASTAISFAGLYYFSIHCGESIYCRDVAVLGNFSFPLYAIIIGILVAIFVIDFEHQIIPDEHVFVLLLIVFGIAIARHDELFLNLFVGFAASVFLLLLNLGTRGNGMGLGDVKLAIPLGMIVGWPGTFLWLTLSFVLGAVVGLLLIAIGKAHFGRHIPFGPFLVVGFLFVLFASSSLLPTLIFS